MLPRDCSANGMFAVHNVMSCQETCIWFFYKRVKASQNYIVQAICASDIWWKSSILEPSGINCYMSITLARIKAEPHKLSFICCFCIFLLCCDK